MLLDRCKGRLSRNNARIHEHRILGKEYTYVCIYSIEHSVRQERARNVYERQWSERERNSLNVRYRFIDKYLLTSASLVYIATKYKCIVP